MISFLEVEKKKTQFGKFCCGSRSKLWTSRLQNGKQLFEEAYGTFLWIQLQSVGINCSNFFFIFVCGDLLESTRWLHSGGIEIALAFEENHNANWYSNCHKMANKYFMNAAFGHARHVIRSRFELLTIEVVEKSFESFDVECLKWDGCEPKALKLLSCLSDLFDYWIWYLILLDLDSNFRLLNLKSILQSICTWYTISS